MSSPPDEADTCWTLGLSNAADEASARRYSSKEDVEELIEEETDEFILADSSWSIWDLIVHLCDGPVKKRREYDFGIYQHCWKLKIMPSSTSSDRPQLAFGPQESSAPSSDYYENCEPLLDLKTTQIKDLASLQVGGILHFEYDFGTTTNIFLHVLREDTNLIVNNKSKKSAVKKEKDTKDIESIPAFKLPKEQQIDAIFPSFSKMIASHKVATVTMGLSHRISRDNDSLFCSVQSSNVPNDILYCPLMFQNLDEFLTLADKSFSQDHTENGDIRESFIARFLFPPSESGKAEFETQMDQLEKEEDDFDSQCGPKKVLFYQDEIQTPDEFSFQACFPKTFEQLSSGKFRWFKYHTKGSLSVAVGRGSGEDSRQMKKSQILRKWKRSFSSFHEILCAVEASWNMPGNPTTPLLITASLPEHDTNLGPSKPIPKQPTVLAKENDTRIISEAGKLPSVTALAIAYGVDPTKPILYTGHQDSSLKKWNLYEDTPSDPIWSISAFKDWSNDEDRERGPWGIAGICVKDESNRHHLVMTWSHMIEGDFENGSPPSEVRVWNGTDGSLHHRLTCSVDIEGNVHPTISTLVLTPLWDEEEEIWLNSVIVGLHAISPSFVYQSDFSNYDYDEAIEGGEGNIVPFSYLQSDSSPSGTKIQQEPTWRAHTGFIRAISVIHKKYVLSLSEHSGTGMADELIIWSPTTLGTPLSKVQFDDNKRSVIDINNFDRSIESIRRSVLQGNVVGMKVLENFVLIGCGYGDRFVVVEILNPDNDEETKLRIARHGTLGQRYYEDDSFEGHMSTSGNVTAIVNASKTDVFLFPVKRLMSSPHLYEDVSKKTSAEQEELDRDNHRILCLRSEAMGIVNCPSRGGEKKKKKVKRQRLMMSFVDLDERASGPFIIALKGRHFVAGFDNGALIASPTLPESFNDSSRGFGLDSSCSREQEGCCERHCPVLEEYENSDIAGSDNLPVNSCPVS